MNARAWLLLAVGLAACELPPGVLYACEPTADPCPEQPGFTCWSDKVCRPGVEPVDGGSGGGLASDGGVAPDAGTDAGLDAGLDAGSDAGLDAGSDAGLDAGSDAGLDAGSDGGASCSPASPAVACSGSPCGYVDAGCGTQLLCEYCLNRKECGVITPNRCDFPSLCTVEGWCWEAPLPQGNDIRAIWGTSSRNLWLATINGTVLRWNGERTLATSAPTLSRYDWHAIDGIDDDNLAVAGDHGAVLLRLDGGWVLERAGSLSDSLGSVLMADGRILVGSRTGGTAVFERTSPGVWTPLQVAGVSEINLFLHQSQVWVLRGNGRLYRQSASGFDLVAIQETLTNATDPLSLGRNIAARSVTPLIDGGQLYRVHVIDPSVPDAGWVEVAAFDLPSANTSGAITRRDGGLLLVGPRDTVRELDALEDGGWRLSPQRLGTITGERSRNFNAATALDGVAFVAGGEGAYAFFQPTVGQWVSTATQDNRNRPITAICEGPLPTRPIAVSEGSVLLERQLDATWLRYDMSTAALPSGMVYRQCTGAPGGRSIIVGDLANVLEYRTPNVFNRLDGGFSATGSDGGQLSWTGVAVTPGNELFAVGAIGNGSSRILTWRLPTGAPRVQFVLGDELESVATMPPPGGSVTWFVGPSGVAFAAGDGGFGPASMVSGSNVGTVVATSVARLADAGSAGFAVGPRGTIWRRPSGGGFGGVRQGIFDEDFTSVWASPIADAFIGGTRDAGVPTPEPAVFVFREGSFLRFDALPISSLGPAGITGFPTDAGTLEVFIGAAQGAILRKRFPADGG